MKSTVGKGFCPVSAAVLLTVMALMQTGCGSGDPEPVEEAVPGIIVNGTALQVTGFSVVPAPPDTVMLSWYGEGPATAGVPLVDPGDSVSVGDTLVMLTEDLRTVELERLNMEVEVALAALRTDPGDTLLLARTDSLESLADSLLLASSRPVTSQVEGEVLTVRVGEGDPVRPGDRLFSLSTGPGALFIVMPPEGVVMAVWPETAGDLSLIEPLDEGAVYSGTGDTPAADFSMVRSTGRNALFEDGLRTLLISLGGDTLEVVRAGTFGTMVVLLIPAGFEEGTEFMTWGN